MAGFSFHHCELRTKEKEKQRRMIGSGERKDENHHQINSFGIVPYYTFSYAQWSFIAFQQMVYFLFFFTSAKRHTLLSFNKLFKKLFFSLFCPMNLSLISFFRELVKVWRKSLNGAYRKRHIKHVQVSFSYKSQYMNW
jgi:hypothetical protein